MIDSLKDINEVSAATRDAVAPVFLLASIGSMLAVMINSLSRAIDRSCILNDVPNDLRVRFNDELELIVRRPRW